MIESRNLMNTIWFKERWINDDYFRIASDSNTKTRIDNTKLGARVGTTPEGSGLGFGFSVCVIDDPLDGEKARSTAEREKPNNWYMNTIRNRYNDPTTGVIIIVAQRLHEDDLPGYVLENEPNEWFHLNIMEEFEKSYTFISPIGFNDKRTREGELICPERFDEDYIEAQKRNPFDYAAKYQQRPAPLTGGLIKKDWLKYYNTAPTLFDIELISADLSMVDTDKADYTVMTVWGKKGRYMYLLDMIREKMDVVAQINSLRYLATQYPRARTKLIEAKANGPAVIKMLERDMSGIVPIQPKDFGGNKEARLNACVPEFSSGCVYLPEFAPYITDIENELLSFPKTKHDDIVDSISQAINWLALNTKSYIAQLPKDEKTGRKTIYDSIRTEPYTVRSIRQIF